MTTQVKTAILVALVAALFIGGGVGTFLANRGSLPGPVAAQEVGMDRAINVTGEGRVSIVPDTARVVLGVQVEGPDLEPLREEANQRMNAVIDGLKADGVPENRIKTVTYDVMVQRDWNRTNQPIVGYTITYLVEVKVQPIEQVSEIIDNALDNGANHVGGISFDVEDRDAAIRQAREQAMNDARRKAEHLAQLGGVNIGPPISITEGAHAAPPMPFQRSYEMDEAVAAGMSAAVEPGETEVVVNVTVAYSIN
jgi:uncharacterized protein